MQRPELPPIDSQTVAFIEAPNLILGDGAERIRVAAGTMGTEFFAYETVRRILQDPSFTARTADFFESGGASEVVLRYVRSGMLTVMPKVDHDRIKRLLAKGFTPRRVKAFDDMVADLAVRLIDRFGDSGEIDLVGDFSHHFTISSIANFIGMPSEDVGRVENFTTNFRLLGQVPIGPGLPKLEETILNVSSYVGALVEERRQSPREDLIGDMIAAEASGEGLTEEELLWSTTNLLNAGHDTTRYQLAACALNLIRFNLWDAVDQQPELLDGVVRESMRMFPATPRQVRIPSTEVEIEGVSCAAGKPLIVNFLAAGWDPDRFVEPERFRLDRTEVYDLGFGVGVHFCLGHALAKLELREGLRAMTSLWEQPILTGAVDFKATGVICGPELLPISFVRRSALRKAG